MYCYIQLVFQRDAGFSDTGGPFTARDISRRHRKGTGSVISAGAATFLPAIILLIAGILAPLPANADSLARIAADIRLDRTMLPEEKDSRLVIDQKTLEKIAKTGRIAATAQPASGQTAAVSTGKGNPGNTVRNRWRRRYATAAKKILRVDEQIRRMQQRIAKLRRRLDTSRKVKDQFRIEDEISARESDIAALRKQRQKLMGELDHVVREARHEGAQPGWFRELPHP